LILGRKGGRHDRRLFLRKGVSGFDGFGGRRKEGMERGGMGFEVHPVL
jgi:hypothetical protein